MKSHTDIPQTLMMKQAWQWLLGVLLLTAVTACHDEDIPVYHPEEQHTEATQALINICQQHPEIERLLRKSISQAAEINPDKRYNPAQSLEEFYDFIDWNVRRLPWDVIDGTKADGGSLYSRTDQGVGYFWFVVDQPLDELKGRGYYYPTVEFVQPFSDWLTTYANSWGDWLSTTASWNDTYYNMVATDPDWGLTKGWYGEGNRWKTFNEFFSRSLASPAMRPIDTEAEVVMPVDSWPKGLWQIDSNNQLVYPENVYVKTAKLSDIGALIGKDSKYATAFAGGTLMHTFLDVNDYHRYHSPVDGELVELRNIPGVAAGGGYTLWDDKAKRYYYINNMGFQMVETRACAIIRTEEYGLVAMLPVGMSQIASVNWIPSLHVGQQLKRGDEMGFFQFGGSDVILIFQQGVEVNLLSKPDGEGGYQHQLMGEALARLKK